MTTKELFDNFQANWTGTLSPFMYEEIQKYIDEDGFKPEVINEALRFAVIKGATTNLCYLSGILKNWKSRGINSVESIKYHEKQREIARDSRVKAVVELDNDFIDMLIVAAALWMDAPEKEMQRLNTLRRA